MLYDKNFEMKKTYTKDQISSILVQVVNTYQNIMQKFKPMHIIVTRI